MRKRLKQFEQGIKEFNKYKSPEATASLIDIKNSEIKVRVSGPFCRNCGFYDYFDDLRIELESSIGADLEITNVIEEDEKSYIIKFVLKRKEMKE